MAGPTPEEIRLQILNSISKLNAAEAAFYQNKLNTLNSVNTSVEEYQRLLRDVNTEYDDMSKNLDYVNKSFKDSVNELKNQKEHINEYTKSLRKISSIAGQLLEIRKGETVYDKKKMGSMEDEVKRKLRILETSKQLFTQGTYQHDQLLEQIADTDSILQNMRGIHDVSEKINKQLGFLPKLAGGIDKALNRLGVPNLGIQDAINETHKLGQAMEAAGDGDKFKAMPTFLSQMKGNIGSIVSLSNILSLSVIALASSLIKADKGAGELAKNMNLTYIEANKARGELGSIATNSMDAALNVRALQESLMFIGNQLGSNAKINEADLKIFTKLREQAGFTNEELFGIQQLSLVNGKSLEKNSKEILGGAKAYASRNKLMLNEKQILRDVSNASASLKLTLGGSAENVAIAAAKARQFGINLQQAESISQSLLNFESSIESELSAELLTGKNLNLERARGLALNGQTADAAAEIAKQVGTSADFAKMNVIQQEAIAKAAGMTKDELATSLMNREALSKLSGKEGEDAQTRFNNLVKEVGLTEAKKRLGDEGLANQFAQQSISERMNQSLEKLQDIFVQLAEPVLAIVSPFVDLLTNILPGVTGAITSLLAPVTWLGDLISSIGTGFAWIGEKINKLIPNLGIMGKIMKAIASVAIITAAYKAFASLATIPVVGVPLGIAAAAATTAAGFGLLSSMKDGEIDYDKGPTVSGEFGTVQLDKNDTGFFNKGKIKAGTDLLGTNKSSSGGGSDQALINEMRQLISEMRNSQNKPTQVSINMDGKRVASAVGNNAKEFYDSSAKYKHKIQ
jgi:hypothetical protein